MKKNYLKKVLASFSIAGLVAGAGLGNVQCSSASG
ncbi:SbtA family thio(seleno)oxazole RiPP natural product precursor [Thermodesulfobacteriota bacterium]